MGCMLWWRTTQKKKKKKKIEARDTLVSKQIKFGS